MNKTQLVDAIAVAADLPKTKAAAILDITLGEITRNLVEGDQVAIVGFGTFTVKKRAARTGRDPRTGGALQIPETMVVAFKAGKGLKDAVNAVELQEAGA